MIGSVLVSVALVSSLGAATAFASATVTDADAHARYGRLFAAGAALALSVATLLLGYQFAVTDYANGYVWAHTVDYLSLPYRLSGLFAGVSGALLFWATCFAVATWRIAGSDEDTAAVGLVATIVTAYFVVLVAVDPPFAPLELSAATRIVGPRGLNPLLVNPYMAIHPPVTFLGYTLTLLPFSVGVVHFGRRLRGIGGCFEAHLARVVTWLRGAWVLLTASVALGALWSYYTLGWGGLWAWDPVQTATLVAWLVLTAALHAVDEYRHGDARPFPAAALSMLSFPAVVFVRVVTQTGVLTSVHAFGVDFDPLLIVLFVGTLVVALGLVIGGWIRAAPRAAEMSASVPYSVVALLLLAAIYAWGVVFPAAHASLSSGGTSFGVDFFNLWTYPVTVALLVALGHHRVRRLDGRIRTHALTLSVAVLVLTVGAAVAPIWKLGSTESGLVYRAFGQVSLLSFVPPAAYALVTELATAGRRVSSGPIRQIIPALGTTLIHVGIVVLVLSVPLSYVAGGPTVDVGPALAGEDSPNDGARYSLTVHEAGTTTRDSGVTFTDRERRLLREQIDDVGFRADALPPSDRENVVLWGRIASIETNASRTTYRLAAADVRVRVDGVGDGTPTQRFAVGDTLYAQGTLETDPSGGRVVDTDDRFVGRDPIRAVILEHRATSARARVTVRDGETTLASGWVGIRSAWNGNTADVLVAGGPIRDVYVVPGQIARYEDTHLVSVSVDRVPGMTAIRVGIGALLLGGILRLWADRDPSNENGETVEPTAKTSNRTDGGTD
jgi:cytochrome c-type biogenesis protein CcmF